MARQATARTDYVPHLPDLIISMAGCWQAIRDAQTEVDPFGRSFAVLEEAGTALDALARHLTGQSGFFALREVRAPRLVLPNSGECSRTLAP